MNSVPTDTLGHALPPPVPSECIDTTPRDMWAAYWRLGLKEMPGGVPKGRWRKRKLAENAPRDLDDDEPPKFWKGFWGRFMDDKYPPQTPWLPDAFWNEYFRRHPSGHTEKPKGRPIKDAKWDPSKHGYYLVRGALRFKHPNGHMYDATGVDVFPPY